MDPLSPNRVPAMPTWPDSPDTPIRSSSSNHITSPLPTSSSISSFREPKVFGAPPPSLVSPPIGQPESGGSSTSQDGTSSRAQQGPFLRVRIGGLERNRKDMLVRFDASTNLPNFRTGLYRNMQRTYADFQRFVEQTSHTSPHTIIPALPLPTTSAMTDAEDDRLVRIALQRWFTRVCDDPVLMRDDELRSFIESEFSYNPVLPASARRQTSSSSAATNVLTAALSKVVRRGPADEDEELASAKGALEKLEGTWGGAATNVNSLGKARRAHAMAFTDVGAKMVSLSTVESDMQLAAAVRKVGRAYEQLANLAGSQAVSENVVLSDSLGYQALNARAAKDALLHRTQILEDSQNAAKAAINKRRNVERLRGASNINPMKVDDAISEMEEANTLEGEYQGRLNAISRHLHVALRAHSRQTHEDVALALLENARLTVGFHKHALRELEALQPDFTRIGTNNAPPISNTASSIHQRPQLPTAPTVPSTMGRAGDPRLSVESDRMSARQGSSPGLLGHVQAPAMDGSKSMFLPSQPPPPISSSGLPARPGSTGPSMSTHTDPLAGMPPGAHMAQSMMLPGQSAQRSQTLGRAQGRRLDERQAAKMLAGGF
ncbi:hypothetical protein BD324DRAFT_634023 [Kockovaella imperatae]|uniref:PX domain-containing protein n=1 Tax=Kockovaella imperatae TaxID=4999 RepID=A0A1Y1UAS2_9TREE|nr:hypothetical protein BD324DRAFT_634023 [Kockovaella imperatae]ORX35138.1 hypothetical protein BD324DRAFT_634023 [Kockovaella imperatae]